MKTIKVVAAAICDSIKDKKQIFATARGYGEFKGQWKFPGGKIEPDETPQEALVREIQEELDVKIKVDDLIDTIEYDYPSFHLSMDCFWCTVVDGKIILKEAEASRWLSKEELYSVDWLPADRELIRKVRNILELERYFKQDDDAFYPKNNGGKDFKGVKSINRCIDSTRNNMAVVQSKLPPASISDVFSCVNQFIEMVREGNGASDNIVRVESIILDDVPHIIMDNGIICNKLNWKSPKYDRKDRRVIWDDKYDIIQTKFHTDAPKNLVWMKFTQKGHVGVVAKGYDINFGGKNEDGKPISSDALIKEAGELWDESFVMIFPMTPEILGKRSVGELELGIGIYLIARGIPIIDFYSHNN